MTFDRKPGAPFTCSNCGRPEAEHAWTCDCGRVLGPGSELPEEWPCKKDLGSVAGHVGASLVCPVVLS